MLLACHAAMSFGGVSAPQRRSRVVQSVTMLADEDPIGSPFVKAINSLQEAIQNSPAANFKAKLAKMQAGDYDEAAVRASLEAYIAEPAVMFSFTTCTCPEPSAAEDCGIREWSNLRVCQDPSVSRPRRSWMAMVPSTLLSVRSSKRADIQQRADTLHGSALSPMQSSTRLKVAIRFVRSSQKKLGARAFQPSMLAVPLWAAAMTAAWAA